MKKFNLILCRNTCVSMWRNKTSASMEFEPNMLKLSFIEIQGPILVLPSLPGFTISHIQPIVLLLRVSKPLEILHNKNESPYCQLTPIRNMGKACFPWLY